MDGSKVLGDDMIQGPCEGVRRQSEGEPWREKAGAGDGSVSCVNADSVEEEGWERWAEDF